jgi:hypothetical protein
VVFGEEAPLDFIGDGHGQMIDSAFPEKKMKNDSFGTVR